MRKSIVGTALLGAAALFSYGCFRSLHPSHKPDALGNAAPIVWQGELAQTAARHIRGGELGTVRLAFADVNWGRIETWHAAPQPFYEVGALFDVGVYPLTLLTSMFGPAVRVSGWGARLLPERVTRDGSPFRIGRPDLTVAMIELAHGPIVRLTSDFYASSLSRQRGVELHGDAGSLWLSNWFQFDGRLERAAFDHDYQAVALLRQPIRVSGDRLQ